MKRRWFLLSSVPALPLLADGLSGGEGTAGEEERPSPEYYELRVYHVRRGRQHDALSEFLQHAWMPAVNRLGISPVGIFEVMTGPESPSIYVLIPYKLLSVLTTLDARLDADSEFQRLGSAIINAPSTDPAYGRLESSLMVAFDGMPHLEKPDFGPRNGDRFFELRIYESHSKKANKKKVEMFNTAEMTIFRRTGLRAVFFGETLIGANLPQLTYMLAFDGMESHDKRQLSRATRSGRN
jgi:hypothetical protein